jgi:hypothetical protein
VLLALVFLYWTTVLVGLFGVESFDIDLDAGADAGADAGEVGHDTGGLFHGALRFLNVGDVPLMIIVSFFIVSMWVMSLVGNRYLPQLLGFEPGALVAVIWFVPNVILSVLLVKVLTMPLRKVFRSFKTGLETRTQIVGKTCVITTSEVTSKFGQAEFVIENGPPIRLNVRADPKEQLGKGDIAFVVSHTPQGDTYEVVAYDPDLDGELE